jgi:hypothetical protein
MGGQGQESSPILAVQLVYWYQYMIAGKEMLKLS